MTFTRKIALATVFGAGALLIGANAQAGLDRIESSVWQPGFQGGEGVYYKYVKTDEAPLGEIDSVEIETSQQFETDTRPAMRGVHVDREAEPELSSFETALGQEREPKVQMRNTWAPGYVKGDNGFYHRGR